MTDITYKIALHNSTIKIVLTDFLDTSYSKPSMTIVNKIHRNIGNLPLNPKKPL